MSLPRLLTYQELAASLKPLTPHDLYRSLRKRRQKIGLTSIYRTLELFVSLGMVFKIVRGSSSRYKLCELKDHHHHIICKTCGDVVEFEFCDIRRWSKKVTESTGYQVTDHQLNFYGFCEACRK